jgi:hypothetical protein
MSRLRKITATVSAIALLGAGGLSAAQAATTSTDSSSSTARPGPKRGGPMSTAQLAATARTLGVTSAQLKAALDASRPARPTGERPDRGAQMATALATALGADADEVKEILDANRPAKPAAGAKRTGARPAKPSNTKLVAALASGLNIDTAKVKAAFATIEAAHKAEHEAREQAMYAAVAKELDLGADAVEAAFEANRPAKPTR